MATAPRASRATSPASRAATRRAGRSAASALRLKLGARIGSIRHFANSLVFLGLIGTVIGFIIALSGVDPDAAADVESIGPMVSTLINGMSVALYTTLVGAILNVWLMVNYRLLESGTVTLVTTDRRAGRAPCTGLISSTTRTAPRSSAMSSCWRWRGSSPWSSCCCRTSIRPASRRSENTQPPGNVIVELRWPDEHRQRRRPVGRGAGRHSGRLLEQGRGDLQSVARRSRQARRRHRDELRGVLFARHSRRASTPSTCISTATPPASCRSR